MPPSPEPENPIVGIPGTLAYACLCSSDGVTIRDFGPQVPVSAESLTPNRLTDLVDGAKLTDFLQLVQARGSVLDWEPDGCSENSPSRLSLNGWLTAAGIFLVAIVTPDSEPDNKIRFGLRGQRQPSPVTSTLVQNPPPLQEQEERVSRLLSHIVHELKNPICSIIGSCEYLVGYCHEDMEPNQLELIRSIEGSARDLLHRASQISKISVAVGSMEKD